MLRRDINRVTQSCEHGFMPSPCRPSPPQEPASLGPAASPLYLGRSRPLPGESWAYVPWCPPPWGTLEKGRLVACTRLIAHIDDGALCLLRRIQYGALCVGANERHLGIRRQLHAYAAPRDGVYLGCRSLADVTRRPPECASER